MSARILPFPPRRLPIRNCRSCSGHFRPAADRHVTCSVCYHWSQALLGIQLMNRAFAALREVRAGDQR